MAYVSATTTQSLVQKISRKLIDENNSAVAVSSVEDALQDALHFWKWKHFWFNESTTTLTMDTSPSLDGTALSDPFVLGYGNTVAQYPNAPVLPQNFLFEFAKDGFVIYYSNLRYRFEKVAPKVYDDCNINGLGIPYIYTYRAGNYEFYFLPNLAYSLHVNYCIDVADFTFVPNETNIFTQNADRILVYEALSHLMGEDRQDPAMDNSYAKKADREYDALKIRGATQNTTGTLSIKTILD